MSNTIPVIVHHETGEKPQFGGKKNQECQFFFNGLKEEIQSDIMRK